MLLGETTSTQYLLEDGLLVSRLKPIQKMTLDDVLENAEMRRTLDLSYPLPFLMDIRALKNMTLRAIMATTNQNDVSQFSAAAILYDNVKQQIIAREGKHFHRASIPLKAFDDDKKALDWLKGFL